MQKGTLIHLALQKLNDENQHHHETKKRENKKNVEGNTLESDLENPNYIIYTTSNDKVTNKNRNKYLKEENSYYTLPKDLKVKCYLNSIDKKCYSPGERVQVTTPIHFIAINKN